MPGDHEQLRLLVPIADGVRPIRLLIVDDEPAICGALERLFGSFGIDAASAVGAAAARDALARTPFDVLLIDLLMPDGRGDELFCDIVAGEPGYRSRALFMTGDIAADADRAIAATGCPYLRKPFDGTLAVQAVAALVGASFAPAPVPPRAAPAATTARLAPNE